MNSLLFLAHLRNYLPYKVAEENGIDFGKSGTAVCLNHLRLLRCSPFELLTNNFLLARKLSIILVVS